MTSLAIVVPRQEDSAMPSALRFPSPPSSWTKLPVARSGALSDDGQDPLFEHHSMSMSTSHTSLPPPKHHKKPSHLITPLSLSHHTASAPVTVQPISIAGNQQQQHPRALASVSPPFSKGGHMRLSTRLPHVAPMVHNVLLPVDADHKKLETELQWNMRHLVAGLHLLSAPSTPAPSAPLHSEQCLPPRHVHFKEGLNSIFGEGATRRGSGPKPKPNPKRPLLLEDRSGSSSRASEPPAKRTRVFPSSSTPPAIPDTNQLEVWVTMIRKLVKGKSRLEPKYMQKLLNTLTAIHSVKHQISREILKTSELDYYMLKLAWLADMPAEAEDLGPAVKKMAQEISEFWGLGSDVSA